VGEINNLRLTILQLCSASFNHIIVRLLATAVAVGGESSKVEASAGSKQKVLMVKDSSAQTTPPSNSPRYRSQPAEVTAGSKVNGGPAEFRTVVNVFDDRLQPTSTSAEMDRRAGVVMDTDSLQSASAGPVNGGRVYTDKPAQRTQADKPHNSKGLSTSTSSMHTRNMKVM